MSDFQIALMEDGTYYYDGNHLVAFSVDATISITDDNLKTSIQDGELSISISG